MSGVAHAHDAPKKETVFSRLSDLEDLVNELASAATNKLEFFVMPGIEKEDQVSLVNTEPEALVKISRIRRQVQSVLNLLQEARL